MQIDTTTLLIAAGAVVAVAGVSFILSTALRRNERFGRIWSIAFIAGILETISEIVAGTSPAGWWAGSVANGALVLAIGLMWAGCRAYNGLRSLAWVAIVTSNVVANPPSAAKHNSLIIDSAAIAAITPVLPPATS